MAAFLLGTFFAAMAGAGYVTELVFGNLGLVPDRAAAKIPDSGVSWDYTTWLNIVFLLLAAVLTARFARTGGGMMLRMMGGAPTAPDERPGHASHAVPGTHGGDTADVSQVAAAPHPDGSPQSGPAGDQGHAHPGQQP
jgi:hypothetical protein